MAKKTDYEQSIKTLTNKCEELKTLKIQTESNIKMHKERLAELEEEFKELGVTPKTAIDEMNSLKKELDDGVHKLNVLLGLEEEEPEEEADDSEETPTELEL